METLLEQVQIENCDIVVKTERWLFDILLLAKCFFQIIQKKCQKLH